MKLTRLVPSLICKKMPIYLIFEVTSRCNSRCNTCFNWKTLNKKNSRKELGLSEIEKMSMGLGCMSWLVIGGGEPYLRPELPEICGLFVRNNCVDNITIPTNGLLPDKIETMTDAILDTTKGHANVSVFVSMDGVGKLNDKIRGVRGGFKLAEESVRRLIGLKARHKKLRVGIGTTISNKNIDGVEELFRYAKDDLKVDFHNYDLLRGTPRTGSYTAPNLEKFKAFWTKIKPILIGYRGYGGAIRSKLVNVTKAAYGDYLIEMLETDRELVPCMAGALAGVVDPFGNVGFCELLPKIGNIRDFGYDFEKLWHSETAGALRKELKEKKCHCTHGCFQQFSMVCSPKSAPFLLRAIF